MERTGPSPWNFRSRKVKGKAVPVRNDLYAIRVGGVRRIQPGHEGHNLGVSQAGGTYCLVDHFRLDHGLIALNIDDQRVRIEALAGSGFRQTISATLMVIPGHDGGRTEPPDGFGDPQVVGCDDDPMDQRRLFDPSIYVLYQGFSVNLDKGFTGETGGIEPGGDDRDGDIKLHQTPQLILARGSGTGQVPLVENLLRNRWRLYEIWGHDPGCNPPEHVHIMALLGTEYRMRPRKEKGHDSEKEQHHCDCLCRDCTSGCVGSVHHAGPKSARCLSRQASDSSAKPNPQGRCGSGTGDRHGYRRPEPVRHGPRTGTFSDLGRQAGTED